MDALLSLINVRIIFVSIIYIIVIIYNSYDNII